MRISLSMGVVVAFLGLIASAHADEKTHLRVKLSVSADDTIRGEVTSYLSRKLRGISDIDVVENDPRFVISVIAMVNRNRGGTHTGNTLSVVVESPVRYPRDSLAMKLDENTLKMTDLLFWKTTRILGHFVQVGAPDELEDLCKKIVASIDGEIFEEWRKGLRPDPVLPPGFRWAE